MFIDLILIVVGAALVLIGADKLTDGAGGIARRFSIPELIIGLTIVAFGTSMPEFVVSLLASINHSPDLSVGNIVGSNIFNTLMILGCTAIVAPIAVERSFVRRDIPFNLFISALFVLLICDSFYRAEATNILSRWDGCILLVLFAYFMYDALKRAHATSADAAVVPAAQPVQPSDTQDKSEAAPAPVWKLALFILFGLVGLIGGGEVFVKGASSLAEAMGVGEAVIGLTVVACGTSLPELATSVMAARKGSSGIAVGNVVGSNTFNILWILGACSVVSPLPALGLTIVDYATLILSMILFWVFARTDYTITRFQGGLLLLAFLGYMGWLLYALPA